MKKIYMILAAMTLLSMSLNAQFQAKKNVAQTQQTTPTGKKVDMPLGVAKMALNPTGHRAPSRATETTTYSYTLQNSNAFSTSGGTAALGDVNWTYSSFTYKGWENARGMQIGSRQSPTSTFTLSTSEIPGTITSITVGANAYSSNATISVTVGGQAFGTTQNLSSSSSAATNTFTGSSSGNIVITMTNASSGGRAMYFKSISVTYETETGNTTDLTVCDGQYFSQYLPLLGYYHDEAQHNQMIYPASMLASMVGKTIKSMTFYPTSGSVTWSGGETESASGINFYNGSVCFKLANISSGSSFDADNPSFVTATLTEVKTVSMPSSANTSATTWVISFDQDFVYTGGDLLIDVTNPTTGDWGLTFFTVDQTGSNYYGYHTSGAGNAALNYLPKVTFTYEGEPNPVHDLAIALDAQPASVGPGSTVTLTATVTNNGNQPENGYTVTFTANGSTINTQTATSELPVGQSTTFTYTYTTTDAQAGTTVNFGANVTCTDDADASNNEATASTSVLTCPPPENVAATVDGNNATMTWDAPIIPSVQQSFIWDFESQSQANEWTLVNADDDNYNWTWDGSGGFKTHSGNGIMYSESYVNYVGALNPDNWMISPEVSLGGSLTLWACGQDNQGYHKEHFAVYVYQGSYSSGTSGFVQVGSIIETNADMTEYPFDLSQFSGTGRIAIRHFDVTDQYRLNVDDISYQVSVTGEQPVSYNIYLDGQLKGNVNANTFSYDFSDVSVGEHTCAVSAVYSYGESAAVPATFTIQHPAELTAPANGSTVDVGTNTGSGTSTTVTVSGSYLTQALSVSVSGDGFSVTPTTISAADANAGTTITVTYNGTDPEATGTLTISSGEVTTTVNLSATYSESEPAFSTNGIIRMGNLIIVDQFWASTAENTHPEQYSYILRYTPAQGDPKESSPKTVDVEHVKSVVNGYYTEEDVKNDSITYNTVIVNKMTADVEMTLPNNDNQIYYVRLQGKDNAVPSEADKVNDNSDMIVKLQMTSGDGGFYYIDQIPASHPQYTPGQVNHFMDPAEPGTGSNYGDFKTYVPSVMTYGQSRRYFANDTLHNTYGAPVWRTGIGDVTIQNGMKVERQSNQWGTTQWEANGQACSLYILDNILAYGKLPNKQNSNVDYEPYMFRVFVESPSGKLRGYTPQNVYSPEKPDSIIGTELVADNSFTNFTGPICIYSEYFDGASHIDMVADATNGDYFKFTLNKNSDNWVDNAMFGGLDDIIQGEGDDLTLSDNDLKVYVRFYYRSKGSMNPSHVIRGRDGSLPHMYYGAEAESPTPDPWTSVTEVRSHGEIIGVTYVNAQGMTSNKPFDGLNIVVTRYSDGSTTTTKVVR